MDFVPDKQENIENKEFAEGQYYGCQNRNEIMVLYRPVGEAEFRLIRELEFQAFPPRLPEQAMSSVLLLILPMEASFQCRQWAGPTIRNFGFQQKNWKLLTNILLAK